MSSHHRLYERLVVGMVTSLHQEKQIFIVTVSIVRMQLFARILFFRILYDSL